MSYWSKTKQDKKMVTKLILLIFCSWILKKNHLFAPLSYCYCLPLYRMLPLLLKTTPSLAIILGLDYNSYYCLWLPLATATILMTTFCYHYCTWLPSVTTIIHDYILLPLLYMTTCPFFYGFSPGEKLQHPDITIFEWYHNTNSAITTQIALSQH